MRIVTTSVWLDVECRKEESYTRGEHTYYGHSSKIP